MNNSELVYKGWAVSELENYPYDKKDFQQCHNHLTKFKKTKYEFDDVIDEMGRKIDNEVNCALILRVVALFDGSIKATWLVEISDEIAVAYKHFDKKQDALYAFENDKIVYKRTLLERKI